MGPCAGCHINGGNIVQANATLFTADLQRNGLIDPDSLYQLIYRGKGRMPGFGQDCAPRVRWPSMKPSSVQQAIRKEGTRLG